MNRLNSTLLGLCLSLAFVALPSCASKQKKAAPPVVTEVGPPPAAPATPTCGGWAVVIETPMIPAGKFDAAALKNALIAGLGEAGCTALSAAPSDGTPVLKIATKASAIGTAGSIMLMATEASSGTIKWRFQEKIAVGQDGSNSISALGKKLAATLGG